MDGIFNIAGPSSVRDMCRRDSANLDSILLTSGGLGNLGLSWKPGSSYQARQLRRRCDFWKKRVWNERSNLEKLFWS